MRIRQEKQLRHGLVIGPEYGLSVSLLLDSGLIEGTISFSNLPSPLSVEYRYFEANLARCCNANRAIHAGPLEERFLPFSNHGVNEYDFFYFEGARTSKRRSASLSTTESLASAWRYLRVGGIAYIEGLGLRSNELNAEIWQPGPEGGMIAFLQAFSGTYTRQETDDFVILEKLTE